MKPRTYWAVVLATGVAFGWLLWLWITNVPEGIVAPRKVVQAETKPLFAPLSLPPPLPEDTVVPAPAAVSDTITDTPEVQTVRARIARRAPIRRVEEPPAPVFAIPDGPAPEAELTVPLDQAEHHVFKLSSVNVEVSITRFYRLTNGKAKGTEYVDMHDWHDWQPPSGQFRNMGEPLTAFSPEDQDYIRSWAWKQAAAAQAAQADANSQQ